MTVRRGLTVFLPATIVFWVAQLWLAGWPCTFWQAITLPAQRLMAAPYETLVQPDEPSVREAAEHLRRIEPDAQRQALLLPRALSGLIWYRRDQETHGQLDVAVTPAEMQALKVSHGWPAMRGDCDDYAVYGASIAAALGVPYRFNTAARHAWVEVRVQEEWRSVFANGHRHAAPAIDTWEPAEGHALLERDLRRNPARAASLQWLCDQPRDPSAGNARPRRFGLGQVYGIASMVTLVAGFVLDRRYLGRGRRPARAASWRRCDGAAAEPTA